MTVSRDTKPWLWRGVFFAVLAFGWLFITWKNHFHISAPLVVICLGYLAVVTTVANLWRTGAAAVTGDEQENDSTWAKPAGALGELEREKRTLLKAIKEAEFDHQMGKLSKLDVDDMIRTYRARAIEVIKEIDRLESGLTGTPREQIMREVRARIELEAKSQKKQDPKVAATFVPDAAKPEVEPAAVEAAAVEAAAVDATPAAVDATPAAVDATPAAVEATVEASPDAAADAKAEAAIDAAIDAKAAAAVEAAAAEAAAKVEVAATEAVKAAATKASAKSSKAEAKSKKKAAAKVDAKTAASLEDDGMDADSTTSVEPKRNDPAKEATP
jgi:colicin import membrane protein